MLAGLVWTRMRGWCGKRDSAKMPFLALYGLRQLCTGLPQFWMQNPCSHQKLCPCDAVRKASKFARNLKGGLQNPPFHYNHSFTIEPYGKRLTLSWTALRLHE